jgi:hypothetical protein
LADKREIDRVYLDILRRKTGEERLRLGMELYEMAFRVVQDGVRHQFPGWNAKQVYTETLRRFALASGRSKLII